MGWLLNLIPQDYKWQIAIKKVGYAVGKLAFTGLTYFKAGALEQKLGIQIDPQAFQNGIATLTIAALEAAHDWARLRWPNASWL